MACVIFRAVPCIYLLTGSPLTSWEQRSCGSSLDPDHHWISRALTQLGRKKDSSTNITEEKVTFAIVPRPSCLLANRLQETLSLCSLVTLVPPPWLLCIPDRPCPRTPEVLSFLLQTRKLRPRWLAQGYVVSEWDSRDKRTKLSGHCCIPRGFTLMT